MCTCHLTNDYVPGKMFTCQHGVNIVIRHIDTIKRKRQLDKLAGRFQCDNCHKCFQLKTGLVLHEAKNKCLPRIIDCKACDKKINRSFWVRHQLTKKHQFNTLMLSKVAEKPVPKDGES